MAPDLSITSTTIPGLLVLRLPVHDDARGWFKENWQRAKMVARGLPDFGPVQHSVAYNSEAGVTRGIHAEPWDKLVSIASGRAFGAWVDLREGPTFGRVHTEELDPATAVFVPQGVGNAYQTLTEGVVYSYLVNEHWSPDADYRHLNLADRTAGVPWPIPLDQATISDKDRTHPDLEHVVPAVPRRPLILGAGGQLGRALTTTFPGARLLTRADVDLADPEAVAALDLSEVDTVINAAAFTAVDDAETPAGRSAAWAVNSTAVSALAQAARRHRCTVVHYSTDYVFDGTAGSGAGGAYRETDPVVPLGVYGQSKAAGESAMRAHPRHYLIRTSWVIGAGGNFVRTMHRLATEGVQPAVVDDQTGRLTFTDDLAAATRHLLDDDAPFGTYHVTSTGSPGTWADIARQVFASAGRDPADVRPVSTEEYVAGSVRQIAPRPRLSVLDLSKIHDAGYSPPDQWARLEQVLTQLRQH